MKRIEEIKKEFNLPDSSFDTHESDLYILAENFDLREGIKGYIIANWKLTPTLFTSDVPGNSWYGKTVIEINFALMDEILEAKKKNGRK